MLAIVDKRIPEQAKKRLAEEFEVVEFFSTGITYEAISGHPDIFFCKLDQMLFVAPNIPNLFVDILEKNKIDFVFGNKEVGLNYPDTATYNAVCWNNLLIHNLKFSDEKMLGNFEPSARVHVNQGYTRCNLLPINNSIITSDIAISKIMEQLGYESLYISPEGIDLPGFKHGFFGGCCGIFKNKVYVLGNLTLQENWLQALKYMEKMQMEVVQLYENALFDGGSILFV